MTTKRTRELSRIRDLLFTITADLRDINDPHLHTRSEVCPHIYYAAQLIHEHLLRTRPGTRTGIARPLVHPPPFRSLEHQGGQPS